jgi:hypothetical protein
MSTLELASIGIGAIRHAVEVIAATRADSLIEYSKPARVEPVCLVDADVLYLPETFDAMQTLQSMFAGYYLQAIALSSTIGRVSVMGKLDQFNPNRDPLTAAAGSQLFDIVPKAISMLSQESYQDALPYFGKPALEEKDITPNTGVSIGKDALKEIREVSQLSVGKMLSVEIEDNGHKGVIPVAIRLIAVDTPTDSLVHILSLGNKDTSMKERYHAWRSGRIEFFRDFVLCLDLIKAHRKNLMNDADGTFTNIVKRQRNNQLSAILSANPSVATASNMVITSANTIAKLELEINGKFDNFRVREKLFSETSLMIVAVLDTQWDRVKFYHRSIPDITSLPYKALKSLTKGDGADIGEILKAYQLGNAPSF